MSLSLYLGMSEVDGVKEEEEFVVKKHVRYFSRCLDILPTQCQSLDTNRLMGGNRDMALIMGVAKP